MFAGKTIPNLIRQESQRFFPDYKRNYEFQMSTCKVSYSELPFVGS